MKHDGSILRLRKRLIPASKAQATTISGLMPHACVGNENQVIKNKKGKTFSMLFENPPS